MKALTLWQPYASLIAEGHKLYETRSWTTSYRGVMLIHSARKWDNGVRMETDQLARKHPELSQYYNREFTLGCIVCAVNLINIHRTEDIRDSLSPLELSVGNFATGRFAWEMEVVKLPDESIPAKGQQGLWDWNP